MAYAYNLVDLWEQGDGVTRTVAMVLLVMSMMSWFVMMTKAWHVLRLRRIAAAAERDFWSACSLSEGLALLNARPGDNPFRALVEEGAAASRHIQNANGRLGDRLDVSDWLTRSLRSSLDEAQANLQTGLGILASVGATAPFVGLFGTVWGIYHALISISQAGQASIDKVAGLSSPT